MKNSHDPCCVSGMYVGVQVVACLLVTEPHSDTWLEEEQAGDGDKDQEKGVLMDSDQVSLLSHSPPLPLTEQRGGPIQGLVDEAEAPPLPNPNPK